MFEQLIGWASAAVIVWVIAEAILHERGTCVARVVRRAGSAPTWSFHRLETAMRFLSGGRRRLKRWENGGKTTAPAVMPGAPRGETWPGAPVGTEATQRRN